MAARGSAVQPLCCRSVTAAEAAFIRTARLLGRGLHLPAACTIDLATATDNQDELYLHLIQGDSFLAEQCRSIEESRIKGIPPRKQGEARAKLTLELGPSGELQLRAKEVAGGTLVIAGQPEVIATSREPA